MGRFKQVFVFLIIATAVLAGSRASAGDDAVGERDAALIRDVIESQLDALRRDDWTEAFGYAAPFIQQKFGSPDTFRRMVMGGYSIVHRPRVVTFKSLETIGGRPAQAVLMTGTDGKSAMVIYFMEKLTEGPWRIGGVSVIPLADLSA
jgi:hypothetical protein